MADQTLRAILTVVDRVSAPMRAINQRLLALTAPLRKVGLAMGEFANVSGLTNLGHAAGNALAHIRSLGAGIMGLAGPLGALAGAGALAGFAEMIRSAAEFGKNLHDASIMTGVAAQALAGLHYAAGMVNVDAGQLDIGLARMNRNLVNAAGGKNKDVAAIFDRMGISLRDANGHIKSADQLLPAVADELKNLQNPALRDAVAMALFGRSGAQLLPLLTKGSAGLAEMTAEAKKHGLVMSDEATASAAKFADGLRNLTESVHGTTLAIGQKLFSVFGPMLKHLTDWIDANRQLIATKIGDFVIGLARWLKQIDWVAVKQGALTFAHVVLGVARAIGSVLRLLGPFWSAILILGAVLGPTILSLGRLAKALGGVALRLGLFALAPVIVMFGQLFTAIEAGIPVMAAFNAVLLANPIGLIVLAIAALGVAAFILWKNWDTIWKGIADTVDSTWAKIKDNPLILGAGFAANLLTNPGGIVAAAMASTATQPAAPAVAGSAFGSAIPRVGEISPMERYPAPYGPGTRGASGAAAAGGKVKVAVSFDNLPQGARAKATTEGNVSDPDLAVGYAMSY
ncbi:MAG TPA: hypothetical protein VFC38_05640 [Stellaceae bacterium]|nr:hypothetical protein [Stellaceae bacterium]